VPCADDEDHGVRATTRTTGTATSSARSPSLPGGCRTRAPRSALAQRVSATPLHLVRDGEVAAL
jgi:hypothetical protein